MWALKAGIPICRQKRWLKFYKNKIVIRQEIKFKFSAKLKQAVKFDI